MEWFKHKIAASRSRLECIEMTYGFAGLGFYWKLYEDVMMCNGALPLAFALSSARRDFPQKKIKSIIYDFGLFTVDSHNMVHIVEDVEEETVDEQAASAPAVDDRRDVISAKNVEVDTKNDVISAKNVEVTTKIDVISAKNDEQSPSNAPARIEENRIKNREEVGGIKRVRQMLTLTTSPEEKRFYEGMLEKCPHVCMMREPLTYQQFQQLRARYPTLHVGEMMQQMENYSLLNKKYRSAYLTLNNWMRREAVDSG